MIETLKLILPLLATAVVAMVGWIVVHRLNAERDLRNKRLELRSRYLLDIDRKLERSCGKPVTREMADDIEIALADLQLLGSTEQVKLAREYIDRYGNQSLGGINVGPIMEDIRNSIRGELGLERTERPVNHFRLHLANERTEAHRGNPSLP
jgi:hypothetical protein